jgi:hypothetical protein
MIIASSQWPAPTADLAIEDGQEELPEGGELLHLFSRCLRWHAYQR